MVAPYEADAQMAFLAFQESVAAIITEDSDLLLHGRHFAAHSNKPILFKLDRATGFAQAIRPSRLKELGSNNDSSDPLRALISHPKFSHDVFRRCCILAGCDYTRGIAGVGLKGAATHLLRHNLDSNSVNTRSLLGVCRR